MSTTEQRIEALRRLVDAGEEQHAHTLAKRWGDVLKAPRTWLLTEEDHEYGECEASSIEEALAEARSNVDASNYEVTETIWIDVHVHCPLTGESRSSTVRLDPEAPACIDGEEHDWQSPHAFVGGIEENPGVWGHGGGVIIHEVCVQCGCGRRTDTWAQRRDTGEQGLTSVSYEPGEYAEELLAPEIQRASCEIKRQCPAAREAGAYVLLAARNEREPVRDCAMSSLTECQRERVAEVCEVLNGLHRDRRGGWRPQGERACRLLLHWIVEHGDREHEPSIAEAVLEALGAAK